ncbi:Drug/metabolite transporter [Macleaya cordata]|nr:Drug/metabolite transporter [Macleaya cordata]
MNIWTRSGQAKVVGTVICLCGTMVMSFYHGPLLLFESDLYWNELAEGVKGGQKATILGPVLVFLSCASCAGWFVIQDRLNRTFFAPYTTTFLMTVMSIPQFGVIGVVESLVTHKSVGHWALGFNVRLLAVLYSGILVSGFGFPVTTWCIQRRGSPYVAMFSPLVLIIVAIIGWFLLHESIHVGPLLGATLIIVGLYMFVWGKNQEIGRQENAAVDNQIVNGDGAQVAQA